jgi:hypothetical protein
MAYVIINGEVNRTFFDGKGASIVEKFTKRDGTEGASYYSAFFAEPHGLEVGDSGVFKGNLSVSLRSYEVEGEVRYSADATINNTKAEDVVSGVGEPAGATTKGF